MQQRNTWGAGEYSANHEVGVSMQLHGRRTAQRDGIQIIDLSEEVEF